MRQALEEDQFAVDAASWNTPGTVTLAFQVQCYCCKAMFSPTVKWGSHTASGEPKGTKCWVCKAVHIGFFGDVTWKDRWA